MARTARPRGVSNNWNKRTPNDLRRSILYFRRAIERDPEYALRGRTIARPRNAYSGSLSMALRKYSMLRRRSFGVRLFQLFETPLGRAVLAIARARSRRAIHRMGAVIPSSKFFDRAWARVFASTVRPCGCATDRG